MNCGKQAKFFAVSALAAILPLFSQARSLADNPGDRALTIIGLTANNALVRFGYDSRRSDKPIPVRGIDGNLQGIDFRPANGLLYGVTDKNKIYVIDPDTGYATAEQTLSTNFSGGFQSGLDFNPQLDRLRLVGSNDQNFSINVDNGTATAQTTLAYIDGDPNFGVDPNITGAAYINNVAGATSTQLYDIDYDLDVLVLHDPPPSGRLKTIGSLGVNFAPVGGFDIFTDANGNNTAFALSGSTLYAIDLNTGAATKFGEMGRSDGFIGLAVTK
jgi:Domain of unknown function (DUF4394)